MKLLKFNLRKIFVLFLAIVAMFVLAACGGKDDELLKELNEAVNSITLEDTTSLKESFRVLNATNKHDLEITWELLENDATLKLEADGDYTKIVVIPTEYTEDANGNQINEWGAGILKATVTKDNKSVDRQWDLYVAPGAKTVELTIAAIKEVAKDTGVEINATVSFVVSAGLFLADDTGGIYVYTSSAPAENVKAGAVVNVKGKKDVYYGMPQISSAIVTVTTAAPTSGYDYSDVAAVDIKDLNDATVEDLEVYGRLVKITGMVIKDYASPANGATVSEYAIKDTITNEVAAIYNSSSKAVKDVLQTKVGEYVSMVVLPYDFHSTQLVWRSYGIEGTIVDADAPVLSDEEIVASVKQEIETALKDKSFASDLTLITKGLVGGTVTWVSGNLEVVANDGKVTLPIEDTEVTLTYTITSNDKTETGTVKVNILALAKMTVKEAIDALDAKEQMVMIEGVIIGADSDGYYYLADETGVVFVRNKLTADGLVVGNKVKIIATGTVYNRTSEYTRQISNIGYVVTKVDDELHDSPLEAVEVEFSDFDFTITKENMGTEVPKELLYGKIVTFEAFIVHRVNGDYTDPYIAASAEAEAAAIIIHHKSVNKSSLDTYLNKKITITGVIYGFNGNSGWRFEYMDREGDVVAEFSEAEKLAIAKAEVEAIVSDDKEVNGDLEFFATAKSSALATAKFTWLSDKVDIIANDGKFSAPTADTDVVITVKVFLDGNVEGTASATYTYTVSAQVPVVTAGGVMISQVYGGGGNSGATLKSDFIELYNSSDQDIDITGWVVWYASATGLFKAIGSESYQTGYVLTGTIKAKSFFLIKAADGAGGTEDLPTPDDTSELGLGGSAFKIALTNSQVVPTAPDSANIVDFIGAASNANLYEGSGAAPAPSNTNAIVRTTLTDTDDNAADFTAADPNPRNSAYKPA